MKNDFGVGEECVRLWDSGLQSEWMLKQSVLDCSVRNWGDNSTERNSDSEGPRQQVWWQGDSVTCHSCDILAKNLATSGPCSENLPEA